MQDTRKVVNGVLLPCILFCFLVGFRCARFKEGQPARLSSKIIQLYFFVVRNQEVTTIVEYCCIFFTVVEKQHPRKTRSMIGGGGGDITSLPPFWEGTVRK